MLADVLALFRDGVLPLPPLRCWDVRQAAEAFRFMSQARHIGKIVLTMPRPLDPEGTVLITGATGALGGQVARHLAGAHGVRHLLLVGRRGADAPGMDGLTGELAVLGARATVAACDVADRAALAALLAAIPAEHPLTGVVHAAGALDDAVLERLDGERLARVLLPKADAALYLDELTRDLDPPLFVFFSSVAGVLGTPGQGNYAAANALLDALAQRRRDAGLAAVSMAWGRWEPAGGMTGRLAAADEARLTRHGILPMSVGDGLALFDAARAGAEALAVPARLAAGRAPSALLRGLAGARSRRTRAGAGSRPVPLADRLVGLAAAELGRVLLESVREHTATVLGHATAGEVQGESVFKDLGFDSLTAVELRNRLSAATGVRLATAAVFNHPTPRALADHLLTLVQPADAAPPALGRLTALEQALTETRPDPQTRAALAGRLRALLVGLDGGETEPETLAEASDDEVFALIDRQLGRA